MAAGPCVRVCLHFSDRDDETCWFLVDFKKMSTIECMQRVISRKFYKSERSSFKLTLKGSLLPAWESTFILRDDDQIIVEHEAAGRHSSEYWSKKKKQKKKLSTNANKFYSNLSVMHNSLGCAETKNTGSLVDSNVEPTLTPQIFQNSVPTPSSETEEHDSSHKKKKKKKSDYTNEIIIDNEELPTPSKKQKISKSCKNDHSCKKTNIASKSKPEIIEVEKDHVTVVSSLCNNQKEDKVNLCNKNNNSPDFKKIKSKLTNVLHEVSLNSDNAIPMETSDTFPNGKDNVSKVSQKNTIEGSVSLSKSANGSEKNLGKDFESGLKSDPDKSYNVQDKSSFSSVQEKVEVYKIGKEDLKNMCQSLRDGETLSIDQDKVKVIDIENASNSSWLDCVEVDSSFPDESKKHDTSSGKESGKGSGNNPRRRRRRRGQRSFACSPFVRAMCQNLDSDADYKSSLSTPVASQLKWNLSSNSSQKHFHFESDTDEDDVDEEENSSESKTIGADKSKTENNSENSKSTLSSEKIVANGAEDPNSSLVLQKEEKDKSSSSQKTSPKKSVHFALETVTCESFDSNQGPIIYKRGQNSSQRRNYPTLIRQQQLNASLESCSSICKSVEENPDAKSVNGCTSKPTKEYNLLPAIVGYPRAGDKIAFKRLEIGEDYTPRLSDFIEAKVISFQEDTKMLTMTTTSSQNNRRKDGKFELFYEDDRDLIILDQPNEITDSVELSTLQEVKLLN